MARLRRGDDAPRVVGFDFGAPAPAAPSWTPEPSGDAPEPPAAAAPPPPAPPPAPPVPPPPPVYSAPYNAVPDYAEPAYPPPYAPAYAAAAPEYAHSYAHSYSSPPAPAPVEAPAGFYAPAVVTAPGPVPSSDQPFQPYRAGAESPAYSPGLPGLSRPARTVGFPVRGLVYLVALVVFVGGGGYRTYKRYFNDPYTRPDRIAEYTRMEGNEVAQLEQRVSGQRLLGVGRPIAGVYGMNDFPAFVLVAGDTSDDDAEMLFADLQRDQVRYNRAVGAPYRANGNLCGTFTDGSSNGTLCLWATKNGSDGAVRFVGVWDLANASRITALAKQALESG